jgi:hypothetical protein
MRQPLLRANKWNIFTERAADVTRFYVLAGLDAVEHLPDEAAERLANAVPEFGAELGQLGFQSRADFAIGIGGASIERIFRAENPFDREVRPCHFSIKANSSFNCGYATQAAKSGESPDLKLCFHSAPTGRNIFPAGVPRVALRFTPGYFRPLSPGGNTRNCRHETTDGKLPIEPSFLPPHARQSKELE